jgi:hypothetical protein
MRVTASRKKAPGTKEPERSEDSRRQPPNIKAPKTSWEDAGDAHFGAWCFPVSLELGAWSLVLLFVRHCVIGEGGSAAFPPALRLFHCAGFRHFASLYTYITLYAGNTR